MKIHFAILALCVACFTQAGCVTPEIASPHEAVVHALPWQPGDKGYYFDLENKNALVAEGIPAIWFASTSRGFYLTALQEEQAGDIRAAKRNPGVWAP